jgi:hypothetical protein
VPITSISESAASISEAFREALEYDNKISEDKLQYSAWLLAVATAGFALAITQGDKILGGSFLPARVGQSLLDLSSVFLGLSAVAGAYVKHYINGEVESCRQRMTLILRQKIMLEADPSLVPHPDNDEIDELVAGITEVRYLPEKKQIQWADAESRGDKAGARYKRALVMQQSAVGGGYLLLFVASVG